MKNKEGNFEISLEPGQDSVISWDSSDYDENLDISANWEVLEEIDYQSIKHHSAHGIVNNN